MDSESIHELSLQQGAGPASCPLVDRFVSTAAIIDLCDDHQVALARLPLRH